MARRRTGSGATPNPTKAAFYIRVSDLRGRSGEEFHSPEVQRANMERFVAPFNLTVVDVIEDIDISGRSFSRDGVDRIRALVEAGAIDSVVVKDVTRFGRNVLESLSFIGWLRERGVALFSTKENIDSTPQGEFMLVQFLAIAQLQSDQIGQAWEDLIARRAELGLHHGTPPLGYRWVDRRLTPDPVVGPAVAAAFKQYADGWPVAHILAALSRARGQRTARRTIKGTLSNPVYLGKVVLHGQTFNGLHEPLVDESTWELVTARLAEDRSTPSRALEVTHALSGLLVCELCDARLGRQKALIKSHGRRIERVYCRRATSADGEWRCPGIGTPRYDAIETVVYQRAHRYLTHLASSHLSLAAARERQSPALAEERAWRQELQQVKAALGKLASAWARNQLTDAEHAEAVKDLRATEQALQGHLARARLVSTAPGPAEAAAAAETLELMWPEALPPERNAMLRKVVHQVRVSPGQPREIEGRVVVCFRGEVSV